MSQKSPNGGCDLSCRIHPTQTHSFRAIRLYQTVHTHSLIPIHSFILSHSSEYSLSFLSRGFTPCRHLRPSASEHIYSDPFIQAYSSIPIHSGPFVHTIHSGLFVHTHSFRPIRPYHSFRPIRPYPFIQAHSAIQFIQAHLAIPIHSGPFVQTHSFRPFHEISTA